MDVMIKVCQICGRTFIAKRSDASCCSPACRMRKKRGAQFNGSSEKAPTTDETLGVVDRAHAVAVDMSRLAMVSPVPLAERLMRISGKIEDALRNEGL